MRKITRQIVLLFVVFVIYFGYSAFIDGVAVYHLNTEMTVYKGTELIGNFSSGLLMGSSGWSKSQIFFQNKQFLLPEGYRAILANGATITGDITQYIGGFMAPNSLLYTILTPFKLVLLAAVFASLVPLFKSLFLGTFLGIRNYLKARRDNILFNYERAIDYTETLKTKLENGDYNQIKKQYGKFKDLAFKPAYLKTMMEEIADYLIRERDTHIFVTPSQVVINSLEEMYRKERQTAKTGRPVEWFFDIRMGYDYTSIGSKYSIAYYETLNRRNQTPMYIAWKVFSLEMYRFPIYLLLAIIPTIILNVIIIPVVSKSSSGKAASFAAPATIVMTFFGIAIILHACFTLTKKHYRHMKYIWVPALVYYFLIIWLGISLVIGINGIQGIGPIYIPGTAIDLMWPFFAALGYALLSTCLIHYIIATLMDGFSDPEGLTKRSIINGIILPAIIWIAATAVNFTGVLGNKNLGLFSGIAFALVAVYWVYLALAGILANNLVPPKKFDSVPASPQAPQLRY